MEPVEDQILVVVVGTVVELVLVVGIELVQFDILEEAVPNQLVDGSSLDQKKTLLVVQLMVQEWQFGLDSVDMESDFLGKLELRIELVEHVVEEEC